MKKEMRKVHKARKDSYTDSDGVHHEHESSWWTDTEVEIDQYGNVIERNPDGSIKKHWGRKNSRDNPIHPCDSDFQKARKIINYERIKRISEGATPEEAWLTKEDIWQLANDFGLNLTDEEID